VIKRISGQSSPGEDQRLEFAMQIRGDQNLFAIIKKGQIGCTYFLAPDEWDLGKSVEINKKVGIFSHGGKIKVPGGVLGSGEAAISIVADNVVIQGLHLQSDGLTGIGISVSANSVYVVDCIIEGFSQGIKVDQGAFVNISQNTFNLNADTAISIVRSQGCKIQGNIIANNPSTAGIAMDSNTTNSLVLGNLLPAGSIQYTHTGKGNQPNNATNAGFTNVANSITVS
jgi:parallel beta-helix repeat protein